MSTVLRVCLLAVPALLTLAAPPRPAQAQPAADAAIVEAREAHRRGDRARLAALRGQAVQAGHALAMWPDYWHLRTRLAEASPAEIGAFLERWRDTYVEDRLRNDWLLELGRRRDWTNFARELPRFRMNDDRSVACYGLLTRHLAGEDVRDAARAAWFAQRDHDDGCQALAATLSEAGRLGPADAWRALMLSIDAGRLRAARATAGLLGPDVARSVAELLDSPARHLARRPPGPSAASRQLGALALMRMATNDPQAARQQLEQPWARGLNRHWTAAVLGSVARQAALKQMPESVALFEQALAVQGRDDDTPELSDESLAWAVRAALRWSTDDSARWSA